jgi:hypothetical protein
MAYLTDEQRDEEREVSLQRALDEPMPRDLNQRIMDLIEPHTMNTGADHDDTMTCIQVAFPVIRDYLRSHPDNVVRCPRCGSQHACLCS